MQRPDEDGPVYYREIQKNAYLKRLTPDNVGGKLRPLGHKKPPPKPMWTLFCVHNGRTPYLEQYPEPSSSATLTHKPVWRACLKTARHVTASVKPHTGNEHDFLIDTDQGPVRMLAPDWASMQDWVQSLRSKLHELKIMSKGENVYCAAPVPPAARVCTRDPNSPLPPTPPQPPDRVPGIELIPTNNSQTSTNQENIENTETQPNEIPIETQPEPTDPTNGSTENSEVQQESIDISDWESTTDITSQPTTSQEVKTKKSEENKEVAKKSVTKICGQNICLDDSILNRKAGDSDEEFFNELDAFSSTIDRLELSESEVTLTFDENADGYRKLDSNGTEQESQSDENANSHSDSNGYRQTVVVNNETREGATSNSVVVDNSSCNNEYQKTNITVIQVSNKPPHTAIPVMGPETNVFNFEFKQNVPITNQSIPVTQIEEKPDNFVNIVNTEANNENGYGTVFATPKENDYGHISLTTTVNLTDVSATENGVYERLCMASTSNDVRKVLNSEKSRKSSLPNLELNQSSSNYEFIFPGNTGSQNNSTSNTASVNNSNSNTTSVNINESENISVVNTNAVRSEPKVISRPKISRNVVNLVPVSNVDSNVRVVRPNIERTLSHNASDRAREERRVFNSPKRDGRNDRTESTTQAKPIWKRGLTELSLLTRLRSIGQGKRHSPTRNDHTDKNPALVSRVVHRSRPEARIDNSRRRSSSLSDERRIVPRTNMPSVRTREVLCLRAEQKRGAALEATVFYPHKPIFMDYDKQVWVASWGGTSGGRAGDRVLSVRGVRVTDAAHAARPPQASPHTYKILYHRVPLAKIYLLNKNTDKEGLGMKLDSECCITSVAVGSAAARADLAAAVGAWAVTEVNNRPVNLIKGGEDDMNRLSSCGREVTVLIQPIAFVKKLRAVLKENKKDLRYS